MRKTHFLVLLVIVLGFSVGGCTMDASTPPENTPSEIDLALTQIATAPSFLQSTPTATEGIGGGDNEETQTAMALSVIQATTPAVITMTPTIQPTAQATQPLSVPGSYTLKKGEWPYCLARRFNINPDSLMNANNITLDMVFS